MFHCLYPASAFMSSSSTRRPAEPIWLVRHPASSADRLELRFAADIKEAAKLQQAFERFLEKLLADCACFDTKNVWHSDQLEGDRGKTILDKAFETLGIITALRPELETTLSTKQQEGFDQGLKTLLTFFEARTQTSGELSSTNLDPEQTFKMVKAFLWTYFALYAPTYIQGKTLDGLNERDVHHFLGDKWNPPARH